MHGVIQSSHHVFRGEHTKVHTDRNLISSSILPAVFSTSLFIHFAFFFYLLLLFISRLYFISFMLWLPSEMWALPADCCGTYTCGTAQGWACSPGLGSGCCLGFWAHVPADPPGSCPAEWPACVARVSHRSGGRGQQNAFPPKCSIAPAATHCWARIA